MWVRRLNGTKKKRAKSARSSTRNSMPGSASRKPLASSTVASPPAPRTKALDTGPKVLLEALCEKLEYKSLLALFSVRHFKAKALKKKLPLPLYEAKRRGLIEAKQREIVALRKKVTATAQPKVSEVLNIKEQLEAIQSSSDKRLPFLESSLREIECGVTEAEELARQYDVANEEYENLAQEAQAHSDKEYSLRTKHQEVSQELTDLATMMPGMDSYAGELQLAQVQAAWESITALLRRFQALSDPEQTDRYFYTRKGMEHHHLAIDATYGLLSLRQGMKLALLKENSDEAKSLSRKIQNMQKEVDLLTAFLINPATPVPCVGEEKYSSLTRATAAARLAKAIPEHYQALASELKEIQERQLCRILINVIQNREFWHAKVALSELRDETTVPRGISAMQEAISDHARVGGEQWYFDSGLRTQFFEELRGVAGEALDNRFLCFFSPPGRDPATSQFYRFLEYIMAEEGAGQYLKAIKEGALDEIFEGPEEQQPEGEPRLSRSPTPTPV